MSMMLLYQMMQMMNEGLPSAYQQVDYLENSGTQYIETNYVPATDFTEITLTFAFVSAQANDSMLFGSYHDSNSKTWQCEKYSERAWYVSCGKYCYRNVLNNAAANKNTVYTLHVDNNALTVDEQSEPTYTERNNANNRPIYIFAWNAESSKYINSGARIYSLEFKENGNVSANFVPCVRKSDSKPGMYDTVSKTFYTNAGTGEFIIPS